LLRQKFVNVIIIIIIINKSINEFNLFKNTAARVLA